MWMRTLHSFRLLFQPVLGLFAVGVKFIRLTVRSQTALAAENLFLRKQLALCSAKTRREPRSNSYISSARTLSFAKTPQKLECYPLSILRGCCVCHSFQKRS